jgi:hypothetical protein
VHHIGPVEQIYYDARVNKTFKKLAENIFVAKNWSVKKTISPKSLTSQS